MIKKTITFSGYDGQKYTEDFYFNLNEAELIEMEISAEGNSLHDGLKKMVDENNGALIMQTFKGIIQKAYGVKSEDGRRFIKNDQVLEEFVQTDAYAKLFFELCTDAAKAAEFVNHVVPSDIKERSEEQAENKPKLEAQTEKPKTMTDAEMREAFERFKAQKESESQ